MPGLPASCQNSARDARTCTKRFATVPNTSVRLLTQTSKMPGLSWSLPAHQACPRANGSICDSCYAAKGCYRFRATRHAQAVRFRWTVEAMRSPADRQRWMETMIRAIRGARCRYFRVHDSGDMFSHTYAECWLEVCRRLPETQFWDSHTCM